jgi:DNA-binding MarR family transcriptional regulator
MTQPNLREEIGKRDEFESREQEVTLNLLRSADYLQTDGHHLLADHGLTGPQYNVLRILRGHGGDGVSCQVVAGQMITRTPDITRLIDRLTEAGLASRDRTAQDRRVVLLKITAAGLELLARLDQPILDMHRRQLAHMSPSELDELNRLLVKVRHPAPPSE